MVADMLTDHLTQAKACFDEMAVLTEAVIAERDRLRAENARLKEALTESQALLNVMNQGRVGVVADMTVGEYVARLQRAIEVNSAALKEAPNG